MKMLGQDNTELVPLAYSPVGCDIQQSLVETEMDLGEAQASPCPTPPLLPEAPLTTSRRLALASPSSTKTNEEGETATPSPVKLLLDEFEEHFEPGAYEQNHFR